MQVPVPSLSDLQDLAREFHIELSQSEAEEYLPHVVSSLDGYATLENLGEEPLQPSYPRDGGRAPDPGDNPGNGWAWRCSIKGRPEGPLAGRTVGVKDNTAIAGLPMRIGSRLMEGFIPDRDATVVTRLLDSGAEIVGKTAVPAFCFDGGGFVGGFDPPVLNVSDPARVPGGSSSGSAAVVVSGAADMALGGDQGGSIRLPASFSGCCGLKPTFGLVPYTGIFPLERTLDHVGPMARTVQDCALMLDALAGRDGLDSRQPNFDPTPASPTLERGIAGLRVGILREGFAIEDASEKEVDDSVRAAVEGLRIAGAEVSEVSVPLHSHGLAIWNAVVVQGCADLVFRGDGVGTNADAGNSAALSDYFALRRREMADAFPPTVKLTLLVAEHVRRNAFHHYYVKGRELGRELRRAYDDALSQVDVLVMPTTAMRAFERPRADAPLDEVFAAALGNLHNTAPFDVTGHPALSVPVPHVDGLPIGFQAVGRHFDEAGVLRVGQAVERL